MTRVQSEPLSTPLQFAVLRVPFFLEPHYDESVVSVETNRARLHKKWGSHWPQQKRQHNLKGRGQAAGIPHFNLDRLASNTMASHRLIQYLGKRYGLAVSEYAYDVLNVYYFVDGHSLNDRPRVAQVVADALQFNPVITTGNNDDDGSMPTAQELLDFLNDDTQGRAEIEAAVRALDELGIHGIPKFIIEGRTVVDGAAGPDVFVSIFRQIEERGMVEDGPVFGDLLGVSARVVQKGSH